MVFVWKVRKSAINPEAIGGYTVDVADLFRGDVVSFSDGFEASVSSAASGLHGRTFARKSCVKTLEDAMLFVEDEIAKRVRALQVQALNNTRIVEA